MRRAPALATASLGLTGMFAGAGCVQQDVHDRALLNSQAQKEQIVRLEEDLATANANLGTARQEIAALQGRISGLAGDIDQESLRSQKWLQRLSQYGPLPVELEMALDQLAGSHPDLVTFDAARGVLRFSGDLTFDSGATELRPEAAETIRVLGGILNEVEAEPFEIQVIGHTDNVPIEKPATKLKHPTNVHLSVHRAIAVRDALCKENVEPQRILVAGYGEFRPLVANSGKKGAAQNRRVELLLVPVSRPQSGRDQATEPAAAEPAGPPDK